MISTGLQKLDKFLSGGIPDGIIVDIFGGRGTGKTLLSFQLMINSIKNGGNVLYLDTSGGFRPERILEIQKELKIDIDLLEKITVSRITNTSEQIKSLQNIAENNFSLMVIDNITDLFSYEYQSDESVFEKNSLFMKYMHELSKFAITNKIPIVVTNMIRTMDDKEVENMQSAIDPFTHIKIHLFKNSSDFNGEIYWALKKEKFSYTITKIGLSDNTEDFYFVDELKLLQLTYQKGSLRIFHVFSVSLIYSLSLSLSFLDVWESLKNLTDNPTSNLLSVIYSSNIIISPIAFFACLKY